MNDGRTPSVYRRVDPRKNARRGWRRWLLPLGVIIGVAVLVAGDWILGRYQDYKIAQAREHRKKLEKMAWFYVRADFDRVAYTPDGKFRVTTWIENVFPEHPAYVMMPAVRTYIQVGSQWKEVPSADLPGSRWAEGTVVKLDGRIETERIFGIEERDYFELLPGYMHIRFDNVMYISDEAEPKDDIFERASVYYIHLRPINADDVKLRAMNEFPGEVPIYISMPPH